MSRFCTLASSSKGNAVYIAGGSTSLLIDCGISFRRLKAALSGFNTDVQDISAVIITHEHTDHISGLKTLLRRCALPLYASEGTLRHLCARDLIPDDAQIIPLAESTVIGDIEVSPFDTPHDAVHSIGLRLNLPDGRRVGVATDLGYVTDIVRDSLTGCDLVMIESNYDPGMLLCGEYPYSVKQRIKGELGHLSNADCALIVSELISCGTTRFVLGHLSERSNLPQLAAQTTRAVLATQKKREGEDFILSVAPAHNPLEMVVF